MRDQEATSRGFRWTLLVALIVAAGCERGGAPPQRTLTVFAASSLRPAFEDVEKRFEAQHPGVDVVLAFAGSHQLRAQLEHGAQADVFASADPRQLQALAERGLVAAPWVFAHNELVMVVRQGSPLRRLADLPDAQRLVLAAPEVPLGWYTEELLTRAATELGEDFAARVRARVVSWELSAPSVVAKLELGEADAAIAYRSDALAAGPAVEVIRLPPSLRVTTDYAAAPLVSAREPKLARAWIERLVSSGSSPTQTPPPRHR